jgi:hypothetical protein
LCETLDFDAELARQKSLRTLKALLAVLPNRADSGPLCPGMPSALLAARAGFCKQELERK